MIADLHVKKRLSISEILEQLGTTENHVRTSMEVHEIKPLTISKLSALAKLPVGETLEMPRLGRRRYYSTIYSRARRAGIRVSIRTGMIEMIKGQGYEVIRAKDEPITAVLNNRERETIDWVLENFGKMSAADISEFSHREKAYRFTKGGELIAYEYAKFFQKLPTPRGH